jgi:hypothetical protein
MSERYWVIIFAIVAAILVIAFLVAVLLAFGA